MSERSSITELDIGKQIGTTTGVATRGLYIYGEAWSASTEDKIYYTFKTLALRDRNGQEKLIYVEGDGDIGSGASESGYVTANAGTGLGKLDTGTFTTDTWYYLYIVYNSETNSIGAVYSTNKNYPSFDNISGYTFYRRVSSLRSSGTAFLNIKQMSDRVFYYAGRSIIGGAVTASAWTSFSIANYIPPVAKSANFVMGSQRKGFGIARESDGTGGSYNQHNYTLVGDDFANTDLFPASRYSWCTLTVPIFEATSLYYYSFYDAGVYISAIGWDENLSIYY